MTAMSVNELTLCLKGQPMNATVPPEWRGIRRDEVKLLVMDRSKRQVEHAVFRDLPSYLSPGDLVVVNTSGTVAANLRARGRTVGALRIHVAGQLPDGNWLVERRGEDDGPDERRFPIGETLTLLGKSEDSIGEVVVARHFHSQSRLWVVETDSNLFSFAVAHGEPIRYGYIHGRPALSLYQTVFARDFHSAEMPSAGRPFTHRVLRKLAERGVKMASLTLHTGVSSHEVIGRLDDHPVIPEWYHIPVATASAVNHAMKQGNRIIAVGTTVVRALEGSLAAHGSLVAPGSGWTSHLVTPDTPPRVVNGLITGLHASQTSHLALLYAFVAESSVRVAYEEAVARGYLWHEFGDSNLIL